ncbi:MAG TPA: hypothetical protein VF384_03220 [Planctomycetota bacterium]
MTPQLRLRLVVVAAEATTIAVTWPLWQVRETPPLLPLCELPPLDFAAPLLACLALALRWPTLGALLHTVVLALAMLADQTREQAPFVSFAILLWAAAPHRGAVAVGALHLIALWFWSGLGKLTSPGFLGHGGAWLLGSDAGEPTAAGIAVAVALGLAELLLAVAACTSRWRTRAALAAALLHLGILAFLVARGANAAVWAWNAALAVAAPLLLRAAPVPAWPVPGTRVPRIAAVAFVLLPLGFHAGAVDAPFAMQVYTRNEPRAVLLGAGGRSERVLYLSELRVPLPPVPRIQRQWFLRSGRRGERLALLEPRPLARWLGARDELLAVSP